MSPTTVELWRRFLGDQKDRQWVLFKHGTCVVVEGKQADARSQATALLRAEGKIKAGSAGGDFSVSSLKELPGWMVTFHRPEILTYVAPAEVARQANDLEIGLLGRSKRQRDSETLEIVHVEN